MVPGRTGRAATRQKLGMFLIEATDVRVHHVLPVFGFQIA